MDGYLTMGNSTIQEFFDQYQDISIEVEQAKMQVDDSQVPDLSKEESITAEQADEHLIACMELERKQNRLEHVSQEWVVAQDILADKLCKINTKVAVIDKRDQTTVLISCVNGAIYIEELN